MQYYKYSILMAVAIVVLGTISLFIGAMDVSIAAIMAGDLEQLNVLLISRLPRLMAILCTGVGMSVAGLLMQNLCMNKFVSPTTGSTVAFAQLGVLLSLIWFTDTSLWQKTAIAFVTSILGTWVFIYFTQKIKFKDIIMVPLIGIMLGNVVGGITTHFAYVYDVMQSLQGALVGDFSLIIKGQYEVVFLVVPLLIVSYWFANHFNIVGLGESFAKNLGVNYNLLLFAGLSIAALLTASIVVTVGAVAYLGLIVPNIVAMFRGDNIRGCLLDVSLFGALFVLACDIFGRLVIFPYELPINLIAGVVGSVVFLVLMFKRLSPAKE
ncbi:ABC transporter permease [Ferrimonas senticii]|uniref:ABC transporter permease n=1 Tax=Ferrimonas senticii TaxID=394566 RepID=UPI0003FD037D|nr:iron chelate uptake ABC transporter family permease subunit [Ferrimonas senticii]